MVKTMDSKSREMICRWMEIAALTTLFRTHDGDAGAGLLSAYDDARVVGQLARFSHVYAALSEYRLEAEAEQECRSPKNDPISPPLSMCWCRSPKNNLRSPPLSKAPSSDRLSTRSVVTMLSWCVASRSPENDPSYPPLSM